MTGQSRVIQDILMDRIQKTQAIAQANTEHLRLQQLASGMMVLDMKDERDQVAQSDHEDAQTQTETALDANMEKIRRLEAELLALDDELQMAIKEQG